MDINDILNEREKTHGDFQDAATVAQIQKVNLRKGPGWGSLMDDQKEALDMIASKIARIMCGDPEIKDHWSDIAGYATLIANKLD